MKTFIVIILMVTFAGIVALVCFALFLLVVNIIEIPWLKYLSVLRRSVASLGRSRARTPHRQSNPSCPTVPNIRSGSPPSTPLS